MMILRAKAAWKKVGVGKSAFFENFVYHEGGDEFVTGTTTVRRVRPVQITPRVSGFVDDELDGVVEGLRAERDAGLQVKVINVRNAKGRFTKRAANKRDLEVA